ncbi:MAG: hypothetical protein HUU55_22730, partial [Myxococcales bacterium]|nr:hypothetical protein [Myxococcales bacterium]
QWLFQNDTGGAQAAEAARVGRRMGEVRDEMVRRLTARRHEEQNPIQGPVVRMPTSEPDPVPIIPRNPLEGLDRIRNLGAFGSFAMVIAIFATDDMDQALAIAEGVDTVGNLGMLAGGAYRARRNAQSFNPTLISGSGSPVVRGGPFGSETYLTELRRLAASGQLESHSAPAPAEFLNRIQWDPNQRPTRRGTPTFIVTEQGIQWQSNRPTSGQRGNGQGFQFDFGANQGLPSFLQLPQSQSGTWGNMEQPPTITLSNGVTVTLQSTTPRQGTSWVFPSTSGGGQQGAGSGQGGASTAGNGRPPSRSVFLQLVSDPQGNALDTDTLIWNRFSEHPNRASIERNLASINVAVEADPGLVGRRGASADVVMVVVNGPNGQSFTRSRIRFSPDQATSQHFHHELNHLLDMQAGRIPRVQLTVVDPVRYSQMQSWRVDQLLDVPRPAAEGEVVMRNARSMAQSRVLEVRNHLRDIAEYGMTSQGGREVPATPGVFAERQRETIRNYVSSLRRLRTSPELSTSQQGELDRYIREYVNGAFPELPAEYQRLMNGRDFFTAAGL